MIFLANHLQRLSGNNMKGGRKIDSCCEVCGSKSIVEVLNLGEHPLCDDLIPIGSNTTCAMYPIDIVFCTNCFTAFQNYDVEKKLIFCAADDQIEVPNADADDGDAPDVTIFDKDDSVVYLDYPGYENYGKERKREISDSMRSRKKVMEDEGYIREAELTSL